MKIKMTGIDYTKADVTVREQFSFTVRQSVELLNEIKDKVSGCVLLSTCNRTELWCSYDKPEEITDPADFLCKYKTADRAAFDAVAVDREDLDAVRHLFYLTGGLKSQIPGDDQILTQVNDALALSREWKACDSGLELLFRMAVTAGKKVRTEVSFDKGNRSAPVLSVTYLKEQGHTLQGKNCLVIGNGQMGQLAADTLVAEGADVTVTIRQYKSGMVLVPKHCRQILYDDRYRAMKNCDYVFSATASPNVTITKKKLEQNMPDGPAVFVDLAVPRDIESTITEISGLTLYNIDTLPIDKVSDEMHMQMKAAEEILEKELEEYRRMAAAKKYLPALKNVSNAAAQEIIRRSSKAISGALVPHEAKGTLEKMIASNSEKVVSRMLFLMRDVLEPDQFLDCLEELEKTMV